MKHDIIVIGASAGGVEILLKLVAGLPADLPASIFVALHTSPEHVSMFPQLLSRRGPLPARHPLHGETIEPGHIYIAPPDNHLLLRPGSMQVVRGPKENNHRPSADALFRTASAAYGPRVIGVVLTGYQDCGTAGMMSIRARGGLSIVQAPDTAVAPSMPSNVIERMPVDHIVAPEDLAALLIRLVETPATPVAAPEAFLAQLEGREPAAPASLVCPTCTGVLTELVAGRFAHFRCHVGHTFSLDTLAHEQAEQMERALWSAVRALEESAALNRRLSATGGDRLQVRFEEAAQTYNRQAKLIREMLLFSGTQPSVSPDTKADVDLDVS